MPLRSEQIIVIMDKKKAAIPDDPYVRGGEGNRTPDLLNAIQTLYQLSYTPEQQGDDSVKAKNLSRRENPNGFTPPEGFLRGSASHLFCQRFIFFIKLTYFHILYWTNVFLLV